jgi:hypothetical protein
MISVERVKGERPAIGFSLLKPTIMEKPVTGISHPPSESVNAYFWALASF